MAKPDYTESSGNVFADLGFANAEEMLAKAELAIRITDILGQRCLTQARAAALLGVDQPKVSALLRGRLAGFSIERLLRFLLRLGADVSITIKPQSHRRSKPRTGKSRRASGFPTAGILTVQQIAHGSASKSRKRQQRAA
jgi:predicted XRE-type DNA-binding protein